MSLKKHNIFTTTITFALFIKIYSAYNLKNVYLSLHLAKRCLDTKTTWYVM